MNGYVYELPTVARRIIGIGGGAWPTPKAIDAIVRHSRKMMEKKYYGNGDVDLTIAVKMRMFPTPTVTSGAQVAWDKTPVQTGGTTLAGYVKYWPTPNASDNRDRGNMSNQSVQRRLEIVKQIGLSTAVKETSDGGTLNPTWVEWLMAWPLGFTDSKHWATVKSRSKRQSRGNS